MEWRLPGAKKREKLIGSCSIDIVSILQVEQVLEICHTAMCIWLTLLNCAPEVVRVNSVFLTVSKHFKVFKRAKRRVKYPEHSPCTRHSLLFHPENSSVNGKALGSFCPLCPHCVSGRPCRTWSTGGRRTKPYESGLCGQTASTRILNLPQEPCGRGFIAQPLGLEA